MPDTDAAALLRRAVEEIWNRGELDVADVLFTADYANHAGLIPDLVRGPEAIKIGVAFYRTAFPDLYITIDALTGQRNAVLLRWTARSATQSNTLTGLLVTCIVGNHIAESWMQWDQASTLERIGLGHPE